MNPLLRRSKNGLCLKSKVDELKEGYKGIDDLKAANQALSSDLDEISARQKTLQAELDTVVLIRDELNYCVYIDAIVIEH